MSDSDTESDSRQSKSKWYPAVGAGMSATSTLTSVLAYGMPYWIQFDESISTSEVGVLSDVSVKFTHGLWRYCNHVTLNTQSVEKCGMIQSHSDTDLATECLLTFSIVLSLSAVVNTFLYLSKVVMVSGKKLCLYIAVLSAILSGIFLAIGLVVYGSANHDIHVTNNISLEYKTTNLYACFWLALTGCFTTTLSTIFIVLTILHKDEPYQQEDDTASMVSSTAFLSEKHQKKFGRPLADYPSSSDDSDDDMTRRDPPPFIPKALVRIATTEDSTLGGQKLDKPRVSKIGLTPVESARILHQELSHMSDISLTSGAMQYLSHGSSYGCKDADHENTTGAECYSSLFGEAAAVGVTPSATFGISRPTVLAVRSTKAPAVFKNVEKSSIEATETLQNAPKEERDDRERKTPCIKPVSKTVLNDNGKLENVYDNPSLGMPYYPEVPVLKLKKKHESPRSQNTKKKGVYVIAPGDTDC